MSQVERITRNDARVALTRIGKALLSAYPRPGSGLVEAMNLMRALVDGLPSDDVCPDCGEPGLEHRELGQCPER